MLDISMVKLVVSMQAGQGIGATNVITATVQQRGRSWRYRI